MTYSPVTESEDFQLELTCVLDSGAPFSLVNWQSIVLVFHPAPGSVSTNTRFVTTGPIVVTDAPNGKATYSPTADDKTALKAGQWLWQLVVLFTTGNKRFGNIQPLEVAEAL